jgi:predicted AlkP superfamily phosphohydrolase/phosphomutase
MMLHELDRLEEGLFFCLFDTPDRVQHMFWRFLEPDHPANGPSGPRPGFEDVIDQQYMAADATVGKALEYADDRTLVIALSDHGFQAFRRGVNLNTWLHDQGWLELANGTRPGPEAGDFFRHVNWSRTKAYAVGLGGIYLNLEGREGQGVVPNGEGKALGNQIATRLSQLQDEANGTSAVQSVVAKEEVYHGDQLDHAPDLVVNFAAGYRGSWGTALGGVPEGCFEDNTSRWSGDHIVDPSLVPGVLMMNRPFRGTGAGLTDLAPTILDALAVPPDAAMEGESLLA